MNDHYTITEIRILVAIGFIMLLSSARSFAEYTNTISGASSNECKFFEAGFSKIITIKSLNSYDTTIISKASSMVRASFAAQGMPLQSSTLSLNCILEFADLDGLVILEFGLITPGWERIILYDPQTEYMNEPYNMGLAGMDYLIMQHDKNPLFKNKLFLTRFYFMLQYALNDRKYFLNEIDSLANIWGRPESRELINSIKNTMIHYEKESVISDSTAPITVVETCIFLWGLDGDSIAKISAKFRENYIENFNVEMLDYVGNKIR